MRNRGLTVVLLSTIGLAGCSGGLSASRSNNSDLDPSSIFANSGTGTDGSGTIGSVTGSGSSSPAPAPSPSPSTIGSVTGSGPSSCGQSNQNDLNALASAITAVSSPASSVDCQASLGTNFSASTTDSSGKVKNYSKPGNSLTALGADCSSSIALEVNKFGDDGLRTYDQNSQRSSSSVAIAKTDLCASGSASPCTPSSSGFILEIQWNNSSNSSSSDMMQIGSQGSNDGTIDQILLKNGTLVSSADLSCEGKTNLMSPLVIEDNPGQGILTLDPLSTQTYFDLAGDSVESRISCVTRGAFLALPDADGQILNINQLFGNNTVGPDGEKAANGFLALGKYDSNLDGVINSKDPVFRRLVLWEDFNCDGIAESNEISSLASRGIAAVQWQDAVLMYQVDPYGNATEERSRVSLANGEVSRIFDLWFKPY